MWTSEEAETCFVVPSHSGALWEATVPWTLQIDSLAQVTHLVLQAPYLQAQDPAYSLAQPFLAATLVMPQPGFWVPQVLLLYPSVPVSQR